MNGVLRSAALLASTLVATGLLLTSTSPASFASVAPTTNATLEGHTMTFESSDTVIRTWVETDADGERRERFAVSNDGREWKRTRAVDSFIRLRYDTFDPLDRTPDVPDMLAHGDAPEPDGENVYIVQFITAPLEEYRDAVRAQGGTVSHYIPGQAHLVHMTPAARDAVAGLPFVRWIGLYEPAYRTEMFLLEQLGNADDDLADLRYNIMVFEAGDEQKATVAERITAMGGVVNRAHAGKYLLEATLTPDQLVEILHWNEVLFVDRWSPYEADMDNVREISGANSLESVAGYTGVGVRGEVLDIGFNVSHVDFDHHPLILHGAVDSNSHGAACSGIIFGDGTGNPQGRGVMPEAQGIVADTDTAFTGQPRYDHTGELLEAPYFAVFQSASVGSAQTTEYTTISADTDAMLFDFDILHCQSQSNLGNQNSRPQAWAKNIVSVGGVRHFDTLTTDDDCWGCRATAASIGPASDGRLKPDLCHFYDSTFTVTTGSDTAYTTSFGGTSGATPITAGHFGLFFQMWSDGLFGNVVDPGGTVFENRPHMTTAKAMMINTANQYQFSGLFHDLTRTHQGWGMVNVQNLYDRRESFLIVDETDLLTENTSATYSVTVSPGEPALRVTMTYADPPAVPGAGVHRVNDLSVRATSPSGDVYWGNNGLAANMWSTPNGSSNTIDTVENIFVQNPEAGTWLVEVFADEINIDGHVETQFNLDADFALVVSGVVPVLPPLVVRLPDGAPSLVPPDAPTDINVEILDGAELYVDGTAEMLYRFGPGAFTSVPLTPLGGNLFMATLPAPPCDSTPEFYFSADGDGGSTVTSPANAPEGTYSTTVGAFDLTFTDDFENDLGWTVTNDGGLVDGPWERGVPIGGGDRGDPPTDADGSGSCYLTDNEDGNSDVDGGTTTLTSPVMNALTMGDPVIAYYRWYSNSSGAAPMTDIFEVEVSDDGGGTWTDLETVGPGGGEVNGGWIYVEYSIADFVDVTDQFRIRFHASDLGDGSVVEAGVDGVMITSFFCEDVKDPCPLDLNGDGNVGPADLAQVLDNWGPNPGHPADFNGDGDVGPADLAALLDGWGDCP